MKRFYFQYQTEAMPKGISIEQFSSRNKVPYNIFYKWYKESAKRIESNLLEFLSVKTLSKILNGCRNFFSMRLDRIFVPMSAEPNLFERCRVQPKIMN